MTDSIRPSIATKIGIVAASFSIPIAVLLFLVITNINEFINFGVSEKHGTTFLRPLDDLMCSLQSHQILSHSSHGDKVTQQKLDVVRDHVEQLLTNLDAVSAQLGNQLEFTEEGLARRNREHLRISELRQQWKTLVASTSGTTHSADSSVDNRHNRLVADIREMITHVGDTSNLILDPDLDSYYLMDVTLLALPQIQERLSRVINFGRDVISRGGPTQDERYQLAVYAALLQESDLDRIVSSSKTALNEDRKFYGISTSLQKKLPQSLVPFELHTKKFIELTSQLAKSSVVDFSAEDYVVAGSKAHTASFTFWNVAETELDGLLDARIGAYSARRTWSLILAGLAVLVASGLAWMATQSITRPLGKLVRTLGPGATLLSASVERIAENSQSKTANQEESSIICEELNAHADDMRKTVNELETLVKGVVIRTNKHSTATSAV